MYESLQITNELNAGVRYNPMNAKAKRGGSTVREDLAANVNMRMQARYKDLHTERAQILALEKESGVSRATIQRLLNPHQQAHKTSILAVEKLAKALRCETHELLMRPRPALKLLPGPTEPFEL